MALGYVYTLSDPTTNLVRYVGQSVNVDKRYSLHLFHSKNGRAKTHKEKWINTLTNNGLKPVIEVVYECPIEQLDEKETQIISLYKSFGAKLTNATLGGLTTRGRKCSEETKAKLSAAMKGRPINYTVSEATRKKIGDRSRGKKASEETRKKISNSKIGKPNQWSNSGLPDWVKEKMTSGSRAACSKPVVLVCIKTGTKLYFDSTIEAAKSLKCDRKGLVRTLRGEYKTYKGYYVLYATIENQDAEVERIKSIPRKKENCKGHKVPHEQHPSIKKVLVYNLSNEKINEFISCETAAAAYGLKPKGVAKNCRGEVKTYFGKIFKYSENATTA